MRPTPSRRRSGGCRSTEKRTDGADREDHTDQRGGEVKVSVEEDQLHREGHVAAPGSMSPCSPRSSRASSCRSTPGSLPTSRARNPSRPESHCRARLRLGLADQPEREGRDEEGSGVEVDGPGLRRTPGWRSRRCRAGQLGGGAARLELGVPLDQVGAVDERREVGLVGDAEEDVEHADHEADQVELLDPQENRG